jgi:small-conductance mechanosensitive channel
VNGFCLRLASLWIQTFQKLKRRFSMLLLIILVVLLFGGGGGYYGYSRWGAGGGIGIGGLILIIVLVVYLMGGVGGAALPR